jgi:hypothetical protein
VEARRAKRAKGGEKAFLPFLVLFVFFASFFALASALPQQRPVLRFARRDYLAGNFVLIPRDGRPPALQLPRLLAQLADHALLAPSSSLFGDTVKREQILKWAVEFDYAETDGLIVSLDALADAPAIASLFAKIRDARANLPIYGFVSLTAAQAALPLCEAGLLDLLIVHPDTATSFTPAQRQTLLATLARRKLLPRVTLSESAEATTMLALARMLNQRFGFAPRISPLVSSSPDAGLRPSLTAQIALLGGSETQTNADLLLLAHTPGTSAQGLRSLVSAIERTTQDGVRCALVDLSESRQQKEALLAALRQRKLLDRLAAYASANPQLHDEREALSRALAQASIWLVGIKFLRDDVERLRRTERTQIGLLLNRLLHDWAYAFAVRHKVEAFAREQLQQAPAQLSEPERAEAFALKELQPLAEELFNEQFKRNIHAVLLASDERAEFEIRLLQRLQIRFPLGNVAEPEIGQAIHLAHLGNFLPPPAVPRASWDFTNGRGLDERLGKRFDAVNWDGFKTNAEAVEVSVSISSNVKAPPEGYALRSRRSGQTRRVEINAATPQGAFYALGKLEQLAAEGQLTQDFNLTETPAFAQRGLLEATAGWSQRERIEMLRLAGRLRLNRYVYAPSGDPLRRERWREKYSNLELARFAELSRVAQENFAQFVYTLSPGTSFGYASDEDFAALTAKLKTLADAGVREFVLSFAEALQEADNQRFKSLAAAQADLLRRASDYLKATQPECRLAALPGLNGKLDYLKELSANLPAEVALCWTGAASATAEHVNFKLREWMAATGRRPLLWDSYPPNDVANGLQSWRVALGPTRVAASNLAQEASGFFASPQQQLRGALLPLATAANYAWDGRAYEPERALSIALNQFFDERSRAGLRVWLKAFGDANAEANLFQPLFQPASDEIKLPLLGQRLQELQAALSFIGSTRERGLLRGELAAFTARLRSAVEKLKSDPSYERLGNGSYRLRPQQSTN